MFNRSEKIRLIVWVIFLLYVFFATTFSFIRLNKIKVVYDENCKVKNELMEETAQAKELYELDDKAYVEGKARNHLGYQYPGEIIYKSIN